MSLTAMGRRMLAVVAVTAMTLCTGANCGIKQVGQNADLVDDLRGAAAPLKSLDDVPDLAGGHSGLGQAASTMDSHLQRVPDNASEDVQAAARQLEQARTAVDEVARIQQQADKALADWPTEARQLAIETTPADIGPPEGLTQLRTTLAEKAQELGLEVACDVSWDAMVQPEQQDVQDAIDAGQAEVTYGSALEMATADAVNTATAAYITELMSDKWAAVVDWPDYGLEVVDKAAQLYDNDWAGLREVVANDHTRALYFWTRVCLRPPS